MKPIMDKTDKILLTLFLMSLAAYLVIFLSAFWDLPLNIPPWHQGLLLYFHSIPMFFLQLLLCRLAKPHWRLFAPLMLLLVPGLVFVGSAGPGMGPVSILVHGTDGRLYSGLDCMGCWEAGPGEGQA